MKVQPAKEPDDFFDLVQEPGEKFLRDTPKPTQKQWQTNNYWTRTSKELHEAYNGICAYYCQYIPKVTGSKTVEHFKPKSKYPEEAYKWSNYRLVCGMMNGRKGNHEDVIDPFDVGEDWFVINFNTYMIEPRDDLSTIERRKVIKTIARLKLNDDECIEGRVIALMKFAEKGDIAYLDFWSPLLAKELRRQNLSEEILRRFRQDKHKFHIE